MRPSWPLATVLALAVCTLAIVTARVAAAHDEVERDQHAPWEPPPPDAQDWDWIRLTSGEWLKGDLERLRERRIDFDSDELGLLELDWDDIAELRSPRNYIYAFEDREVLTGPGVVRDGVVRVRTGDGVVERPRTELLSVVAGGERERDYWDGKLSIALSQRSGNTDQVEGTGYAYLRRASAFMRARLDYNGAYGEVDGSETVNNHRATGKLDLFLSRRAYVTPVSVEIREDVRTGGSVVHVTADHDNVKIGEERRLKSGYFRT